MVVVDRVADHVDAGAAQPPEATAGDQWVRIAQADPDTANSRLEDRLTTGAGPAVVATRLEGDHHRGAGGGRRN